MNIGVTSVLSGMTDLVATVCFLRCAFNASLWFSYVYVR